MLRPIRTNAVLVKLFACRVICFCCRLLTFFKLTFSKYSFRNTIRVSNGLGPDLGPDLGPNLFAKVIS